VAGAPGAGICARAAEYIAPSAPLSAPTRAAAAPAVGLRWPSGYLPWWGWLRMREASFCTRAPCAVQAPDL